MTKKTIISMIECANLVALAVVIRFLFRTLPLTAADGGSYSLAMLPLLVLALRRGSVYGLVGGILYGTISFIYGSSSHILSLLLDYLIAFGAVGILGLGKKDKNYLQIIMLVCTIILIRLASSTLCGIVVYKVSFIPSLIYNAPYILVSGLACLIILLILKNRSIIYMSLHIEEDKYEKDDYI